MKIALNNSCNSKCPYCFAGNMGIDKTTNITIDNFKKILNKMALDGDKLLTLLGGEPTIHPQFEEILNISNEYCEMFDWNLLVLTNGVNIYKYINLFQKNANFLINVNNINTLGPKQCEELLKSLDALRDNGFIEPQSSSVTLGCNLHIECSDYNYFWEIVDIYGTKKIRVSVASPQNNEYLHNRDSYFKIMKPVFMEFVNNAYERNVELILDCSQIPPCYFSPAELYMVVKVAGTGTDPLGKCEPLFEVMPDMTVSCCFGDKNYKNSKHTVDDFKIFREAGDYFRDMRFMDMKNNYHLEKCFDCLLAKNNLCFGGCFGFTDNLNSLLEEINNAQEKTY